MSATPTADAQALRAWERAELDLPDGLELEWLGVSGYRLTYEGISLFVDPYVSRVPLRALLLRRPAMPDEALVDRYLAAPGPVAGVLVGHTHFDHAVDAPAVARRHGAKAYGSASLGAPHAPARPRAPGGRGRAAPAVRAGAVHRALHPQPPLEAPVRAQGPDGRRAHLRPPRRPLAGRLQVRGGVRHPHRRRRG